MDLLDVIAQSYGGRGIQVLGAKFGLNERQTRAAIDQLAPAVMAGLRRQIRSPEGVSGLVSALATGNHRRYLDEEDDDMVNDGKAILGHVFKSKDVSRGVADRAAQASGVTADVLRKMLPVVSAMVMGALSKQVMGDQARVGSAPDRPGRGSSAEAHLRGRSGAAGRASASRSTETRGGPGTSARSTTPSRPAQVTAAPPATAPEPGGLGGILGQLFGGGSSAAANPAASGGGLGAILGQFVGAGGGGASPGGGGLGDILNGIFGNDAKPEVRDQATRSVGDLLGGLLGGGTTRGASADEMLDGVTRARTSR